MERKAAFHNLGCKVNAYETEAMMQMLEADGYKIVPFAPGADVYVINTCTVTNIADRKSRQILHRAKKMNPDAVVVAVGCYAQMRGEELEKDPAIDLVIGSARKKELAEQIKTFLETGNKHTAASDLLHDRTYEALQVDHASKGARAYIKAQDGCDMFCTYCIIPYARGRVRSRLPEDVCNEAKLLVQSGAKEIVLTGIHICSYGKDLGAGIDLTDLIRMVHETEGLERLRLGSLEPSYITEKTAESLASLTRLCPHFHLSLQSGCGTVLKRMGRRYTPEEFADKTAILRRVFDEPALTTDIIAGFPGETEEEFAETLAFADRIRFFETHVFPYSRREGTRAASMDGQCTEQIKKDRVRRLLEKHDINQQAYLQQFLHKPLEVLFEETVCENGVIFQAGHGTRYQKVLFRSETDLSGRLQTVVPQNVQDGILFA
ncbi:MAG: tRNA (N(6)-L-threonylcarbamoyladenosine(37)-C(2))-methylthiotransferase MtaB [Eubacterium sp.]|nr:tRNA (N(6)-L-threonylcarbamoyladenosine(37)-C(2))-methylthiotransferase MtaB [Eubacterium sp.]